MNFISKIIGFFSGSKTLQAWLGDSCRPVSKEEAERRSKICETCVYNQPIYGITDEAAKAVEKWVTIKNNRKLSVRNEEKLHYCLACSCKLSLKCHVPYEYIKQYQSSEVSDKIKAVQPACWQL